MQENTNLQAFDAWVSWKDNAYELKIHANLSRTAPKRLSESVTLACLDLGLRPKVDFQITMYEVRFRTKTFLAMFKMNYKDE